MPRPVHPRATETGSGVPDIVTLSATEVGSAASRRLQSSLANSASITVPGRLGYDARYRLDYGSPVRAASCRACSSRCGRRWRKTPSLAEVSSPDTVGMARDEVRKREADRQIERRPPTGPRRSPKTWRSCSTRSPATAAAADRRGFQDRARVVPGRRSSVPTRGCCTSRRSMPARATRRGRGAFGPHHRGADEQHSGDRQGQLLRRL